MKALFLTFLGLVQIGLSDPHAQAESIHWEDFWKKATESSPRIQVLQIRIEREKAPVSLELPPPMLSAGRMGKDNPWSAGMEQSWEVTQKVPFPSKFALANHAQQSRIHQTELEAEVSLIELQNQAYGQFVSLHALLSKREIILSKKRFFQDHLKRLKAYTISDQVQQLHILEMEAELQGIESELKYLDGEESRLRLELGSWLSTRSELFADDPQLESINLNIPAKTKDPTQSPYVKLSRTFEETRSREKSLANSEWLPDLSLTYRRRIRQDGFMPNSHELMLGVELPFLIPSQPIAKSNEASLKQEEARLNHLQSAIDVRSRQQALRDRLEALREQLHLMRDSILPNLEKRMRLLHRLAQTDLESLSLHRSVFDQLFMNQEKEIDLDTRYRTTLFELETLTGGAQ